MTLLPRRRKDNLLEVANRRSTEYETPHTLFHQGEDSLAFLRSTTARSEETSTRLFFPRLQGFLVPVRRLNASITASAVVPENRFSCEDAMRER